MPHSMTGFAAVDASVEPFQLTWELRSVNHRFLDLGFRLPDELRRLEPEYRQRVSAVIRRGKVDCTLKLSLRSDGARGAAPDTRALANLRTLQDAVRAAFPAAAPLSVADVLRWPGALEEPQREVAQLAEPSRAALGEALEALQAARASEGERLAGLLEQRCAAVVALIEQLGPSLSAIQQRQRDKLVERLRRLDVQAEPERLEQEIALAVQRLDVSEELDRLAGHVEEVRAVLGREEPAGRRLDFLIQELNREANTLGSKSQDEQMTRAAVEIKVLVEQMREQVQNLE